jgi:hypothetical protein
MLVDISFLYLPLFNPSILSCISHSSFLSIISILSPISLSPSLFLHPFYFPFRFAGYTLPTRINVFLSSQAMLPALLLDCLWNYKDTLRLIKFNLHSSKPLLHQLVHLFVTMTLPFHFSVFILYIAM